MAGRSTKFFKNKVAAKLVTENRQPCVFCQQDVDDEVIFGKLYSLGDIQCHYFCVLLSCCLVQKGKDTEGLYGFLYKDIMAEVERSKKHKCSFCGRGGASLGCAVGQCRKQFHLPCGRQKNAVSLFYGNYRSFCELHAPKQKISAEVMAHVKVRRKMERMTKANKVVDKVEKTNQVSEPDSSVSVCVICYEEVQGYPTTQTFWPPCCGRDAWLHRTCLQRMALSAGMHYLKCPLCNDKDQFYEAVCEQGYYLPDRDAAWELEQNAFAEIYERPAACGAVDCKCPFGRSHDEPGLWDIQLCLLCGSTGAHAHCCGASRLVCASCRPAAAELGDLEDRLAEMIAAEQEREARAARSGPVMPSRMSLRRTKGRIAAQSASSSSQNLPKTSPSEIKTENEPQSQKPSSISRQELNLKTPRRAKFLEPSILRDLDNKLLSPIKMLEQSYMEKLGNLEEAVINTKELIEKMRAKFNKPKPLCEKKRIVNEIIEDLFKNVLEDGLKSRDFAKEWCSPKKCIQITDIHEDVKGNMKTIETERYEENDDKTNSENNLQNVDNFGNENSTATNDIQEKDEQIDLAEDDKENIQNNKSTDDTHPGNDNDSTIDQDDSSNSTFQLPPEFIAESDESIFETPKKLKTVDIEHNSSLEISENNECVNIDVIEIEDGESINETITSIKNKESESLKVNSIDTDIETFKDQYLKEVDRFKCNFNHKHLDNRDTGKLRTVIDFAIDARHRKRKLDSDTKEIGKKRKRHNADDKEKSRKRRKKLKRKEMKRKLKEKNHLKIKFKEERKSKPKAKHTEVRKAKTFKQYVLKFSPTKPKVKQILEKPENDFTPLKRKYVKNEKSSDTLVQTSIQSFFKVK